MTEMFGEAWSPMSVPDLAPDDDDDDLVIKCFIYLILKSFLQTLQYACCVPLLLRCSQLL